VKKYLAVVMLLTCFSACDRRPVPKDLPHSNGNPGEHTNMSRDMESSPNAPTSPYELQFVDSMIVHHEAAIDMAQLVQTRAAHAELKEFARRIISHQQEEVVQMRRLRDKFFAGAPLAVNMTLPGMQMGTHGMDLEKLDSLKGNGFDNEFMNQMIPHHEGAIEMANDALAKLPSEQTNDAEMIGSLRQLAQSIVSAQTAEVKEMRQWQATWTQ